MSACRISLHHFLRTRLSCLTDVHKLSVPSFCYGITCGFVTLLLWHYMRLFYVIVMALRGTCGFVTLFLWH